MHTCVFRGCLGGGPLHLSEPRHGTCYLFLISPALCGFPAVTGLRVETGTNEQLHPACLPGIMGLQSDRASVCALFLHFHFVVPLFTLSLLLDFSHPLVQLYFFHPLDKNPFSHFNSSNSYHVMSFNFVQSRSLCCFSSRFFFYDFVAASHSYRMLSLTAEE